MTVRPIWTLAFAALVLYVIPPSMLLLTAAVMLVLWTPILLLVWYATKDIR